MYQCRNLELSDWRTNKTLQCVLSTFYQLAFSVGRQIMYARGRSSILVSGESGSEFYLVSKTLN